jgi:hypothetical protein
MKLTKAQLRKIVQANLLETPLMDILPFKNKWNPNSTDSVASSVGYRLPSRMKGTEQEKRKNFTNAAKVYLADSEDNWYIVVLKNVGYYDYDPANTIKSPEFLQWMSSLNIPKGSKILIPGQSNLKGDYRAPEWQIVHDIIGHTIESYYTENILSSQIQSSVQAKISKFFRGYPILHQYKTWTTLPDEFKIAKSEPDDRLPDIFAAIFANKFDRQKAVSLLNSAEAPGEDLCDALYSLVEEWKKSIPYDDPTVIYPFGNDL